MYSSHTPAKGAVFRNEDGAFDLPSILVGVVVVGILTAGVLATIFGIIPFAQDNGIKQDLSALRTAQGVAKAKDGRFMSDAELRNAGYLSGEPVVAAVSAPGTLDMERMASKKKIAAGASADGSCFISVGKSGTGKIFFLTDADAEAKNLKTTDIPACLTADAFQALLDAIGGFDPSSLPGAPTGVTGSATGPATVTFTWPAVGDATAYTVSYRVNGGTWTQVPGTQTTTSTVVDAAKGDTVDVAVEAINLAGSSDPGTATVTLPKPMGNVLSWGRNSNGMLGQGIASVTASSYVATAVKDLPGKATAVAAGIGMHQCAVVDGAAYCWGQNSQGQLGNNTKVDSNVPVKVQGLDGKTVTAIGVGTAHSCALADGKAYCWGQTGNGEMGNGTTTVGSQLTAMPVTASGALAGKTATAISVGGNHACVIANGAAYCWGRNFHGQIGNPSNITQMNAPVAVVTTAMTGTVTSISAGNQHTCAAAAGKAYCWGDFTAGKLGSSQTVKQYSPIAVTASGALSGKTVTSVTAGGNHSCAIANGAAYCWGSNGWGVLGTNNTTSTTAPVAVVGLTGTVTELSANATNTCAVVNDVPYCWGYGQYGSNGDGTTVTTQRNAPTLLAGITGPVAHISMGNLAGMLAYK